MSTSCSTCVRSSVNAVNKRELRLELCKRALTLAEHPKVRVSTGLYAHKSSLGGTLTVCLLGALAHEALAHDLLGSAQLEGGTVLELFYQGHLFGPHTRADFIRELLGLLWEVEDLALMETAFESNVSRPLSRHIKLRSGYTSNLWRYYNERQRPDTLSDQGDKNLVAQFDAARVLRQYVPDDTERYRRVLQNVILHGGLYNPWG